MTPKKQPRAPVTANQVVAYNLRRARDLRGWKQEDAAMRLAPYGVGGEEWSKAVWSAAERTFDGERIRHFDADDLIAFARAFDLPIYWFFLPPEQDASGNPWPRVAPTQSKAPPLTPGHLLDLIFPSIPGEGLQHVIRRLADMFGDETRPGSLPEGLRSEPQKLAADHALELALVAARSRLGDLGRWAGTLREIKDFFEGLQGQLSGRSEGDARDRRAKERGGLERGGKGK